jgi:hypothetical protein
MKKSAEHIRAAQEAARAGMPPHAILKLLLDRVAPTSPMRPPRLVIEYYLMSAFGIPLRTARDIEPWEGFSKDGTVTDQDIDALLSPWIAQHLAREARLPIHDLYGFLETTMKTAQEQVSQALDMPLCAAYDTYRGGDYYCTTCGSTESLVIQRNFDSAEQEWTEAALQRYAVLLFIRVATSDRAEQIRRQLSVHVPTAVHVRRIAT